MGLLNELEEIKRKERENKKSLQKLKKNFYKEVVDKIEEMRVNARIYIEKMDIEKAGKIMDEIKKIEKSLDEIIALRVRKILLSTVWKKEKSIKNLTNEEEILYREVRDAIERLHGIIYKKEEAPLQEKLEEEKKKEEPAEQYILVRVKVPHIKIALPTKDLFLKKEDVLHIPEKIYKILLKNDVIEEIKLT